MVSSARRSFFAGSRRAISRIFSGPVRDSDHPAGGGISGDDRSLLLAVNPDREYEGGYHAAEKERPDDRPRDLGEGEGEEEADASAEGDEELAGVDGADDLARLHAP